MLEDLQSSLKHAGARFHAEFLCYTHYLSEHHSVNYGLWVLHVMTRLRS